MANCGPIGGDGEIRVFGHMCPNTEGQCAANGTPLIHHNLRFYA